MKWHSNYLSSSKFIITLLLIFLCICACDNDKMIVDDEENDPSSEPCVIFEENVITSDSFWIYPPYDLGLGTASAIKLFKEWSAGGFMDGDSIARYILLRTKHQDPPILILENMAFHQLPPDLKPGCYFLTGDRQLALADDAYVHTDYTTLDGDVGDEDYDLIEGEQNFLEIVNTDSSEMKVFMKFSASFEKDTTHTNNWWNPVYVRFINGEMEMNL